MDESTELLGGIAEFDSMEVVLVITSLEETLNVTVEDDEISADPVHVHVSQLPVRTRSLLAIQ